MIAKALHLKLDVQEVQPYSPQQDQDLGPQSPRARRHCYPREHRSHETRRPPVYRVKLQLLL